MQYLSGGQAFQTLNGGFGGQKPKTTYLVVGTDYCVVEFSVTVGTMGLFIACCDMSGMQLIGILGNYLAYLTSLQRIKQHSQSFFVFFSTVAKFFLYAGGLVGQQIIEKSHFISIEYIFLFMIMQQIRQIYLPMFHSAFLYYATFTTHNLARQHLFNLSSHQFKTLKQSDFILNATLVAFSHNSGSLIRIFSNLICWDHSINTLKLFI